jgi:Xaa-Pro aminopeptidase
VLVDKASAAFEVVRRIEAGGGKVVAGSDPVLLPKALKNPTELQASAPPTSATASPWCASSPGSTARRRKAGSTRSPSPGSSRVPRRHRRAARHLLRHHRRPGPNAAIPHYHVSTASNRQVEPNGILLVDSGAQYQDGTTDITRTMIVGTPTEEMADRFTRVLIGHIRLTLARFPKGNHRRPSRHSGPRKLWEAGLDFDHGTGHGVGHYLAVHEGPGRIAKTGHVPLEPGMLMSNEPGFYKAGAWGIRIENLVIVTARRPLTAASGR